MKKEKRLNDSTTQFKEFLRLRFAVGSDALAKVPGATLGFRGAVSFMIIRELKVVN